MKMQSYSLRRFIRIYDLQVEEAYRTEHEIGQYYYCDYWCQFFKVLDVKVEHGWPQITCQWDDGHINTHSTSLGRWDHKILNPENLKELFENASN